MKEENEHRETRVLVTAPTQDVMSLAEVKEQLRIADDMQDDIVSAILAATSAQLDPAMGGWLGRALRPQTWEFRLDRFPCREIELPFPPLISVDSVKYDDANGTEQTLAEGVSFRVLGLGGRGKQSIAPLYNQIWPAARCDFESVRIRFTSGYDADEDPDALPKPIKQAIQIGVAKLYSLGEKSIYLNRQSIAGLIDKSWSISADLEDTVKSMMDGLLSTYRVW